MTRTAILSDIHGNLTALLAVLDHIESQNVDRIICLGDVVGYGPKPCECLDLVMKFDFCILGNHDSSAMFDPEGFNAAAEQAIFWTRTQLESTSGDEQADENGITPSRRRMNFLCGLPRTVREDNNLFVHGSPRGPTNEYVMPEDVQNSKKMEKLFSLVPKLCFQGHTHVPGVFTMNSRFVRPDEIEDKFDLTTAGDRLMINVGSVGQPRDLDPRSCYVVMDEQSIQYHRIEYDIEKTVSQIEAEPELDNFLGYRLREGR
ncbi:metallophosphoesterase family protein [Rhodopirellula sp. MGV]|uniref:metallophosphoesterase family protein n=1 Tax=Rhodopirellula sp. MGV TaxID=2023130 RepID=UPI000B95DEDD|nr:metallophosphoesterase family protein [Rhodopirellula sp. MGV]OYP35928.1 phosphoesterase [Rhodopirellula sp. MGV]PNY34894.1 phosphoesterase [Rhodopirellula baltica]